MASTDRSIFHPFWSYYDGIARCFTCRNLECRNVFVYLRFTTFYNQATFTLSLFFVISFGGHEFALESFQPRNKTDYRALQFEKSPDAGVHTDDADMWVTPFEPFQGKSGKIVEPLKKMMLLCLYSGRLRIKFPLQV